MPTKLKAHRRLAPVTCSAASNNKLTLKWGTLKAWNFEGNTAAIKLLKRYNKIGASFSAMMQHDTPEQKEIICQMIDLMPGDIYLDWDGKYVSHEEAEKYVREYGKDKPLERQAQARRRQPKIMKSKLNLLTATALAVACSALLCGCTCKCKCPILTGTFSGGYPGQDVGLTNLAMPDWMYSTNINGIEIWPPK